MRQHPAAEKYESLMERIEELQKQTEQISKEFATIQNELQFLNKVHRDYVKEVLTEIPGEETLESRLKRYKNIIKRLGIKTSKEDLNFVKTDILGLLAYFNEEWKEDL